jgi:hypothetical protein
MRRILVVAVLVMTTSSAFAAGTPNGAEIESLTGAQGKLDEKEGAFKVSVPRSDLEVHAAGVHLTPPMGSRPGRHSRARARTRWSWATSV